jgi:hypothetical protein
VIIFSNTAFGKEFKTLFEINHKIESGVSIDKSLNQSFDKMVYRLSGSSNPSYIWRIINSGTVRKDFIVSYSVNQMDGDSFLRTQFNQKLLEEKFRQLEIPLIGKSRPMFIVIAKIDNGVDEPYFLNDDVANVFDKSFKELINTISENRGVFIEIPILDLIDTQNIKDFNYLLDPNDYLKSKYSYEDIVNVEITKIDIENWSVTGDIEKLIKSANFQNEFIELFQKTLNDKVSKYLNGLQIEFSEKNTLSLNIANIQSVEDYENVIDGLNSIIGIEGIKINAFAKNTLISDIYFFGNIERFINVIDDKSRFKLTNVSDNKKDIFIEYKK